MNKVVLIPLLVIVLVVAAFALGDKPEMSPTVDGGSTTLGTTTGEPDDTVSSGDTAGTTTSGTPDGVVAKKCYIGGCSAQICSDQPDVASTCEFREEYACYKSTNATCEVQPSGQCGWTDSPALTACLNAAIN